jgi:hypothetical protein
VIDQNELRAAFQATASEMPDGLELIGVTFHGPEGHREWVAFAGENGDPKRGLRGMGRHAVRGAHRPAAPHPGGQLLAAVVMRLLLFAVVGIAGWMVGSVVGIAVGIGIDLVFLGDQPSGPGATVVSTVWGTAMIGAIVGLVGSIIWLATRMARNAA